MGCDEMAGNGNEYIGKFIKVVYTDDGTTKIVKGTCITIDDFTVTVKTLDNKLKTVGKSVVIAFGEVG